MKKMIFGLLMSICMLCIATFQNAEGVEVEGVSFESDAIYIDGKKVAEGATVMLTDDDAIVIITLNEDGESVAYESINPCHLDYNPYIPQSICTDRCPDGKTCNETCSDCIEGEPLGNLCEFISLSGQGEVCYDGCPWGQICTVDCDECILYDPTPRPVPCQFVDVGEGPVCLDLCPDGLNCDVTCSECEEDIDTRCKREPFTGFCEDSCPDGEECSPGCVYCREKSQDD